MELETLHLIALIITAPVILYADHMGFQYFTGRMQTLPLQKVQWAHRLVTVGLLILIATGIWMTIPMWAVMLEKPFFYAKMAFVATLFLNGLFIGQLMNKATTVPFAGLTRDEKNLLLVSGAVSGISWVASVLIGFFGI